MGKKKTKVKRAVRKKKINKMHVSMFIIVCFGIFLSFLYGYSLGLLHKHSTPISKLVPNFVLSEIERDTDLLDKTFSIKILFDNKKILLNNTIFYPHGWYFEEIETDLDNENILSSKKFLITSPNEDVKLYIIPKTINNLRSVISATLDTSVTVLSDNEVERKCLSSIDTSEFSEFESITLYRENIEDNEIKYTQKVDSTAVLEEQDLPLNEFIVFKREGGFIKDDEVVWTAEILLQFDDSMSSSEKMERLKIVDQIVSSLRIV